ncbi:MAG: T9SS type A sorting domain-containing protein [Fibrobacter sp.]|nr:T9SS type A sorting domain-containing protein [Fibrobacter sp.]
MGKSFSTLLSAAFLATLCGTASAYTLNGTVLTKDGKAIQDADVKLLKRNKATTTDEQGKFTFKETSTGINAVRSAGSFNMVNGVLSFSQAGSAPVQVKIFDMVGNQVFAHTFQGAGSVDLNSVIEAQGTYMARVTLGSAQETFRFNATGNFSGFVKQNRKALMKLDNDADTLSVAKEGFETTKVFLPNLDTTVTIKLNEVVSEETFKFGYALGNTPRPSKGCGKATTLKATRQVENGGQFSLNVGGKNRTFFITLPKNYDNTKPHKLLIANHCMGSKAEDFVHHSPDYDHPSPYYGQQNLDKNGDYIFVAPQGNDNGTWNGKEDHQFVDEMITAMYDNYCVDTTRVFATGFSFGAMFTNSLAQDMQERLRAVAVYAVADYNIWLPSAGTGRYDAKELPIAWMLVHGKGDGTCDYNRAKNSALPRILKRNGKADADGNFTDASSEKPEEINNNTAGHVCYDFKNVDPRFPVKFCSWNGPHRWPAHDEGDYSNYTSNSWNKSWVPEEVHKFFEQF